MPTFVQISSIIYSLLVALAFVFHAIPFSFSTPKNVVSQEIISYVEQEELAIEEPQFLVQRADWFDADVYEYPGTLLASSYGHDVTLTIDERAEIQPLFEEFDRKVSELISNWTPTPEDWF